LQSSPAMGGTLTLAHLADRDSVTWQWRHACLPMFTITRDRLDIATPGRADALARILNELLLPGVRIEVCCRHRLLSMDTVYVQWVRPRAGVYQIERVAADADSWVDSVVASDVHYFDWILHCFHGSASAAVMLNIRQRIRLFTHPVATKHSTVPATALTSGATIP
jgi:hypothetical protein